jgi:hypothetical protein
MKWSVTPVTIEAALFSIVSVAVIAVVVASTVAIYVASRRLRETDRETIASLRQEVEDLRTQERANYAEIRRLLGEVNRLDVKLGRWQRYAEDVAAALEHATGEKAPPPPADEPIPAPPPRPIGPNEPVRLQRRIAACFSPGEITDLAIELGLDGAIKEAGAEDMARDLTRLAKGRGLTNRLIELCRRERPEGGF